MHPDLGRSKLKLFVMDPNLAYVDTFDGRLLDAFRAPAPLHQLSIRHLDIAPDDTICVAAQYEGAANIHPPLVAVHRGTSALQWLDAPDDVYRKMRNYCGSGRGGLFRYCPSAEQRASPVRIDTADIRWDNHMLRLSL